MKSWISFLSCLLFFLCACGVDENGNSSGVSPGSGTTTERYDLDISVILEMQPDGGSKKMNIVASDNFRWTINKDGNGNWLTVSTMSGTGPATITLSAENNTTGKRRTTTLTITGAGMTKTLAVVQEVVSVDDPVQPEVESIDVSQDFELMPAGGSKALTVHASGNLKWAITKGSDSEWMTVSPMSGTGEAVVTLSAQQNDTGSKRYATFTLTGGGMTKTYSVVQDVAGPDEEDRNLDISQDYELLPQGDSKVLTVHASDNLAWTITKDGGGEWLTVNPTNGAGTTAVTLSAGRNDTGNMRYATLTLSGAGMKRMITVCQDKLFTACPDNNHPHAIDMGLPSGTLWACCNVDAADPDLPGGFYAWGETVTKSVYNAESYLVKVVDEDDEYYYNPDYGTDIAGTEHDVAHVKWGGSWQMPCKAQKDELHDNCTGGRAVINGVEGHFYQAKNGNLLFFPSAGYMYNEELTSVGSRTDCWLSTANTKKTGCAYTLTFIGSMKSIGTSAEKYHGMNVRPVMTP